MMGAVVVCGRSLCSRAAASRLAVIGMRAGAFVRCGNVNATCFI